MDAREFEKIGLTSGEAKVYLALLKSGSSTTGPLVDLSGVSRSKIYHILGRLIEKGLVTYILESQTKYFQATDPSRLLSYLASRAQELEEHRRLVTALLPQLEAYKKLGVREEAEIYHGFAGVKAARELALKELRKGDTFYCFGANKINLKPLQGFWEDFHRRRALMGIRARYLIQEESRAAFGPGTIYQSSKSLIESRYFDTLGPVHIDIFGDYVVTCILQGTATSFLIKNKFVADYYRDYFAKIWSLARK